MGHDVFISHSSKDKLTADAICHTLEQNGVTCWIAPRDVRGGFNFGEEIILGIENCKLMVLIFSEESNNSSYVYAEVERAFSKGKIIIPYRLSKIEMNRNLELFLSGKHWIDAYPNDKVFDNLVTAVKNALGMTLDDKQNVQNPPKQLVVQSASMSSSAITAKNFFTQELEKLPGENDGLVYLLDTPIYSLTKPHWDQFVFTKSGNVLHSNHYGKSPDSVSIKSGIYDYVSSGEYTVRNSIIEFTSKLRTDNTKWGRYKCRVMDDGNIEIDGELESSYQYGTILYCGTYEDRFFNPSDKFDAVKKEIDKGYVIGKVDLPPVVQTKSEPYKPQPQPVAESQTAHVPPGNEPRGNTAGNIVNSGLVAKEGDWIYYQNKSDGNKLYKSRIDGSGKTKLNDDDCTCINAIGDWVYYGNNSDSARLYKISSDGSGRVKLNDDRSWSITVIDNWVYYVNGNENSKLYKIRTDGSDKTKLNDDLSISINVVGDWVYYNSWSSKLYKIRTDGSNKTKLSDDNSFKINVINDWVYYVNASDHYKFYKMRTDGSNRTKLNDDSGAYINVAGDWIYYMNGNDNSKLYKMRTDGSDGTKLNNDNSWDINIINDWVYYSNLNDGAYAQKLYKMRTDGTERQLVD
ncbi:MAG: DUF5050 domain-containing protein [Oscillospiraceae bacterium]|nr:DUF5050 domain-containing protein [Oscillospiraceae bacterium]